MAAAACPEGWQIEALLPFPEEEYLKDFQQSAQRRRPRCDRGASRQPEEGHDRHATARAQAARPQQVVRGCRRLPAAPGRCPDRGMGRRTAKARRHRRDRARGVRRRYSGGVAPDDRRPLAAAHHRLRPRGQSDRRPTPTAPTDRWPTRSLPVFAAPAPTALDDARGSARDCLERFLAERWRGRFFFSAYDLMQRIANCRWPRPIIRAPAFEMRRREWDSFLAAAPDADNLHEPVARRPADTVHLGGHARGALLASLSQRLCVAYLLSAMRGVHCARRPVLRRRS